MARTGGDVIGQRKAAWRRIPANEEYKEQWDDSDKRKERRDEIDKAEDGARALVALR